jgi:hypothetical protein
VSASEKRFCSSWRIAATSASDSEKSDRASSSSNAAVAISNGSRSSSRPRATGSSPKIFFN